MCYFLCLYIIHAYRYEFKTSFTNISGSNGPIVIKSTQLFQWAIQILNTSFQGILIIFQNFLILDLNWYSGLLGP